jgi:hypothetical protein
VTTWSALASSSPIVVPAGASLAIVASVKATHTADDLIAFALKRGLIVNDFAEEGHRAGLGPDPRGPDYRYVAAIASATQSVKLPWEVPWPASMFDDSQVVSAWLGAANSNPTPPAPPAPEPPRDPAMGNFSTIVFAGVVTWAAIETARWLLKGRRAGTR